MLSGFFHFLGTLALIWLDPATRAAEPGALLGEVGAEFAGALVFRTLALYGVAGLAGLVARAVGGTGGYYETRAALFWAALVAAVPMLAVTLAGALLAPVLSRARAPRSRARPACSSPGPQRRPWPPPTASAAPRRSSPGSWRSPPSSRRLPGTRPEAMIRPSRKSFALEASSCRLRAQPERS